MSQYRSINEIFKEIRSSKPYYMMPMGYVSGYPMLTVKSSRVCVAVPYYKYHITGEVDQTEVYPIRYVITYAVQDGVIVASEDLQKNKAFAQVDFNKPVGTFRHDSIKSLNKHQYAEKQQELYGMYDNLIAAMIENRDYPIEQLQQFKDLLSTLVPPSLKPFYQVLHPHFYRSFMA